MQTKRKTIKRERLEISSRKLEDTKGTLHAKMSTIKDRNGMDLTEAEGIKKRWQGQPHRWQPTRLLRPWDSPGKNTGVGCHLLQFISLALSLCIFRLLTSFQRDKA